MVDVKHEKSEEQRKQEKDEAFGEKRLRENTILCFRSWCRQCIKRRGRQEDCREATQEERQIPEIHLARMFMGDEKEGENRGMFGGQRKGDESCALHVGSEEVDGRMDMLKAWLREIRLEFVDIIVKSDNEPARTSLIESWGTLRAMKSGSRMIIETVQWAVRRATGSSRAPSKSVQGMVRTIIVEELVGGEE